MIPTVHEKRGYERQEEGMIPTAFEKRGYERQEEGMIPTALEKCGYERQEEGMIPTVFEKRGYERFVNDLENEGIWNITIGRRTICLQIIGRYKIV